MSLHDDALVPHSLGSFSCYPQEWTRWDNPTELLQFLTGYVTWRCGLDMRPVDLGVMSRDANWLVNPCTTCELVTIYRSRVSTNYNFTLIASLKSQFLRFLGLMRLNFKCHPFNTQEALPLPKLCIMTYCALGCVQRCDLWAWQRNETKTETFMRQTGYLPRPLTST